MQRILSMIILLWGVFSCFGVTTSLQFNEGGILSNPRSVRITLADETGNSQIADHESLAKAPNLHFNLKPVTRDDFPKQDIETLESLMIVQDGREILPVSINSISEDGKVTALHLQYNKQDMKLEKEFVFKTGAMISDPLLLDEIFREEYYSSKARYDQGKAAYNDASYLEGYEFLKFFIEPDENVQALSFYEQARNTLTSTIDLQISKIGADYNMLALQTTQKTEKADLARIDSLLAFCLDCDTIFIDYMDKIDADAKDKLSKLTSGLEELKITCFNRYMKGIEDEMLSYDYRSAKFTSFMGGLVDILMSSSNTKISKDIELSIALLPKDNPHLRKIMMFGFDDNFTEFLDFVHHYISTENTLFPETLRVHLENLQPDEPEPYSAILTAIELYLAGNFIEFNIKMKDAVKHCSNWKLLLGMEQKILFNSSNIASLNADAKARFSDALQAFKNGQTTQIKQKFSLLKNLYPDIAASYYILANLSLAESDDFNALFEYENVIIYKPDIISAQLYFVQQEIKSEQFEKAELSVKDFINRNPAWFLYMKLAEIYFSQQKYNMAKSVIEEQCQKLNPHNFRQYLLLGDIYASQGDKVLAKEKYLEAGRLNPDDTSFREKIMGLE